MIYWNLPIDWQQTHNALRYEDSSVRFNPSGVERMDELVELAKMPDIKLILSLDSHAGFIGNGEGPTSNNAQYTGVSYSFRNGGVGANFVYSNYGDQEGGFGGGGCGGWGGSGGGGGYSGGGGGGSYNSGSNQDNSAGAWEGHGKVTITKN